VSSNQFNAPKRVKLSFCGLQSIPNGGWMPLWTLFEPLAGHSANSTLSEITLNKLGVVAPNPTGLKRGDVFEL
jgi:hypothetical protein